MFIPYGDTVKNLIWKKLEMFIAFCGIALPILYLVLDGRKLSKSLDSEYQIAGVKKSPFFTGYYADLNDGQLEYFIEGLPSLILIAFIFTTLKRVINKVLQNHDAIILYYLIFGISTITYIHGSGVLILLLLLLVNHLLSITLSGYRIFPLIVWTLNLSFLLLTEYYKGFKFSWLSLSLAFLDRHSGIMKWSDISKLCMLKIVSYMIDHHWKVINKFTVPFDKHKPKCDECTDTSKCLKFRMDEHGEEFGLNNLIAYVFYPPLYLAGPTVSYNAWISQVKVPQGTYNGKALLLYAARLLLTFIILIWFIHNLYFPTIANHRRNEYILSSFTPYELIIVSYCVLKWIWLKFTVIWRFFRLWALMDGIETPENMNRCMSNNYCFEGFWRSWHRSFNQWLIRYLFIPLGGSKYKVVNIWVVFGFVAIWHDLTLSLLAWGWGMCLFIMPEVLVKAYFARPSMSGFRKTLIYSWLCAIAGGFYICLMILANLVGFSFGVRGLRVMLEGLLNIEGMILMAKVMIILTSAAHFMFLYREDEGRRGIKNKGF